MIVYRVEIIPGPPECVYVDIGHRFNVALERTENGLSLRVYPRTGGELWDAPFATFDVDEAEIIALESEMEA
jgi:hypothetical protein